jgi:hypothetical protein
MLQFQVAGIFLRVPASGWGACFPGIGAPLLLPTYRAFRQVALNSGTLSGSNPSMSRSRMCRHSGPRGAGHLLREADDTGKWRPANGTAGAGRGALNRHGEVIENAGGHTAHESGRPLNLVATRAPPIVEYENLADPGAVRSPLRRRGDYRRGLLPAPQYQAD